MKVIFDTNVLFAALVARRGLCARIVDSSLLQHSILISQAILDELRENLAKKTKLSSQQIDEAVELFRQASTLVRPVDVPADACRDADDLVILGTAIAGGADVLVTGDDDLLVLVRYDNIPIMTPREFHDRFLIPPASNQP